MARSSAAVGPLNSKSMTAAPSAPVVVDMPSSLACITVIVCPLPGVAPGSPGRAAVVVVVVVVVVVLHGGVGGTWAMLPPVRAASSDPFKYWAACSADMPGSACITARTSPSATPYSAGDRFANTSTPRTGLDEPLGPAISWLR